MAAVAAESQYAASWGGSAQLSYIIIAVVIVITIFVVAVLILII